MTLLSALDRVLELSGKATAGEWEVKLSPVNRPLGDNWSIADCGGSSEADENSDDNNVFVIAPIMDYCRPAEDDAALIAAAVNLVRDPRLREVVDAGQHVTATFRKLGTADGFVDQAHARMACEDAMTRLDTALALARGGRGDG